MGMYTTLFDPSGREWQFKTGYDECECYYLGDKIFGKVYADKDHDGVHMATEVTRNDVAAHAFVLVRNNIIECMLPHLVSIRSPDGSPVVSDGCALTLEMTSELWERKFSTEFLHKSTARRVVSDRDPSLDDEMFEAERAIDKLLFDIKTRNLNDDEYLKARYERLGDVFVSYIWGALKRPGFSVAIPADPEFETDQEHELNDKEILIQKLKMAITALEEMK